MADGLGPELSAAAALGGETGARFAAFDWTAHPFGEPASWPPEWSCAVATALTSKFPIVLFLGPELNLVYNDAYLPMLGRKHPAALGAPGREVWSEIWDPIGPMLAGVMGTGEATWSRDLMLALASEGWPQERYFTFSYGPIVGAGGAVSGVFCAVSETTERVLGERRFQVLTRMAGELFQTRTVEEAVAAAVGVCDGTHPDVPMLAVYLDDDGESVLAGASETAKDRVPAQLPQPGDVPAARAQPVELTGDPPEARNPADAPPPTQALVLPLAGAVTAGTRGRLLLGLNPHRPLDEQYRAFCGLLADQVSAAIANAGSFEAERERADALAQLDHAKTMFLTNVSHEFRTPLTLLLGPLRDLIDTEPDPGRRDRLATAHRNAGRLLRLVNALLEFARTEAGHSEAAPRLVDLGALTAQIASSFTDLCRQAGLALVLDCAPAAARVDVEMWETVVLNLLSNAVKFTRSGQITVTVAASAEDGVAVTVSDTGTGIAPRDLERLFERFYQADNSRARTAEGSGIGLSLVRSLVELHGGTIRVDSALDVGTTVRIHLPVLQGDTLPESGSAPPGEHGNAYVTEALGWVDRPAAASAEPPERPVGRPLVLIVDDNANMRLHLQQICSAHWDVALAGDGAAALEAMRRRRPDVVVTDVMMPAMDGLDLVAAIRADEDLARVPVVMLSARAGTEAAGTGLEAGADDYLPKPFTSQDLVHRIRARLAAHGREQHHHQAQQERTRHAQAMAAFSAALAASATPEEILDAVRAGPAALGAPLAAVGIVEPDTATIRLSFSGDLSAEERDRYHVLAADAPLPLPQVARTGHPMIIPDTAALDPDYAPVIRDLSVIRRAAVIHPLRDRTGTVSAALALTWPEPRGFSPDELCLVEEALPAIAAALERIQAADREHRIAVGFQEHHLDLDRTSGAAVLGALYQPATETLRVGGDWYLAAPGSHPDQVAVCVGDVVGHGLAAATAMSRLRSAATAAALTDPRPAFTLDLLDRYARTVPDAFCATAAYALLDTRHGTLDYLCAGHPYPLLVTPDGQARHLARGRRPPLAVTAAPTGPPGRTRLPEGAFLLLYTDGLIERPGESLDTGLARLARTAARLTTQPTDAICTELLAAMAPAGGYRDDVALLAVRPTGTTPASFVAAQPADPAELPALRERLRAWLGQLGVDRQLTDDVLLSCSEAVANAVAHGSPAGPRQTVSVELFAGPDTITASVTDTGGWTGDSAASRRRDGRGGGGGGLTLIHGLSEHVDIVRGPRGTRVTMHHSRTPRASTGAAP